MEPWLSMTPRFSSSCKHSHTRHLCHEHAHRLSLQANNSSQRPQRSQQPTHCWQINIPSQEIPKSIQKSIHRCCQLCFNYDEAPNLHLPARARFPGHGYAS